MITASLRDHYEVLQVSRGASRAEVQAAFRRLAKVYHPDKNPHRVPWAESKMHELLGAYEVLVDEHRRAAYDRQRTPVSRSGMSFVERMKSRPDDPRAQSRLILHYLLQGDFDHAIELHEKLAFRRATFSLANHLDEYDYLDALFLLGEAYETREQWHTATRFYWEAYERERSGTQRRYFFEDLKDRLRVLFSQRLVRGLSPEGLLRSYRRALALGIGDRDAAVLYKKIAAVESQLGRREAAVAALDKAKRLCPRMKTIDLLRKRIAGN